MGFYKNKIVLVAGGTGMIGIPTVRLLVEAGAKVKVVSMDSAAFAAKVLPAGVSFERRDLTDMKQCTQAVRGQDYVLNLVGIKGSVGIGQTKVASYLVPMLRFQTNLMEAAFLNRSERFLFVGSICSYPQSAEPKQEDSMWNGMPLQNDRIPGLAKRMGEVQAEAYALEHQWAAPRIVRPANVYGPYDDFNPATAQVIPSLIARMTSGENPMKIWGDGTAIRDFIYSEDLAAWLLVALEKAPPCLPLNLGGGQPVTIRRLAETIAATLSQPPVLAWDSTKPTGDPIRHLSVERAAGAIGFKPTVTLEQGIRRTVDWYLQHKNLRKDAAA
jgi:GDP-L-fucose synthase